MTDTNWVGVVPEPPTPPVRHSCAVDGHEYEHTVTADGVLLAIHCGYCHRAWRVEEV